MWMPGNFSSWRMLPITRSMPMLVPMANSAYAVGVGIGMGIVPKVLFERLIVAGDAGDTVSLDVDGERMVAEDTVAGA